ncbi:MAG: GGDEF domain-containing protein [Glaciimonas sp.]|nr:GGDEF domain-containing protein [Glaciimonas sp.]
MNQISTEKSVAAFKPACAHSHRSTETEQILLERLHEIIDSQLLSALFQPIIQLQNGEIIGYEGLIRGPSDSPLHSPLNLFKVAWANNLTVKLEHLCRQVVMKKFAELDLPGKLFLNVSPECLLDRDAKYSQTLDMIQQIGIHPERVIIELTENQPTYDYQLLGQAVTHYRQMGFQIAIDDLGEGFSSLRLWSELRPEYVKIDMHFIQGIDNDPIKMQFVKSIQEIAEKSGTKVIAEGIETQAEMLLVRSLGVAHGQGYHIARPHAQPAIVLSAEVENILGNNSTQLSSKNCSQRQYTVTAIKLLQQLPTVAPDMRNNQVYEMFLAQPALQIIPVVEDGKPLGLITRENLIERFSKLYQRELYGKKPCSGFMDRNPLIVDRDTSLQELSNIIVKADRQQFTNGFIITEKGHYLGMGTGQDFVREITQLQINAARYANPLTLLPGNVPINEHIEHLLNSGSHFYACYCDLDHFKPFNDAYGYQRGDDVIQSTSQILVDKVDPELDWVGHIGGDDFIVLLQSDNWQARCDAILQQFACMIQSYYSIEDRQRGGYLSEDRQGVKVFCPLISLSIGIVKVEPGKFYSHHQISTAIAEAKKQAKKISGNSIFIDRRLGPGPMSAPLSRSISTPTTEVH